MKIDESNLETIFSIGESFFSVNNAQQLLEMILGGAKQICKAERATLFLSEGEEEDGEEYLKSYVATDIGGELKEIKLASNIGIVGYSYKTKEAQIVNDVQKSPYFNPKIDELTHFETKSIMSVPLLNNKDEPLGVIQVLNKEGGDFDQEDLKKVKLLSLLAISALNKLKDAQEMNKMKKRIREYNQSKSRHMNWETKNVDLKKIYEKTKVVSKSNSSVLLLGESGVGKEVMARFIHEQSDRKLGPFVAVNCAAIPKELFEAELFGIKKGTATGVEEREGLFQKAHGGTLFFDEIGEMPIELQAKLLRALQEKKITRVGESEEVAVDCRIVSATNRNLKEAISQDRFREDLLFRINVFEFQLPPLRERIEDIESLSEKLIEGICFEQNFNLKSLGSEGIDKLMSYDWPGNIRELKNVLERACVLAQGKNEISSLEILLPSDLPPVKLHKESSNKNEAHYDEYFTLNNDMNYATKKFQKAYAMKVIKACSGNKSRAAKDLNLSREGLRKILNREVA
ncbi:MAG: sigma-54-dependent Fis family transcriptional regulator [Bdellovibrionales bacterium]|nr:sigma-54-dependent Fis family transcriptional regulator [Bdellovibrionales bacterium]NQZ19862.1 sigma-54-dependent Fis family transcriptional regulator [Bdellovibrionales bacterium]